MKKLLAIALIAASLSANAFFNSNDMPWNNNYNNSNGYQKDNGMFGYNPYNIMDPRWYIEEMSNMIDEFDDEFNNDNNSWNNNNNFNGYNPYNNFNSPYNNTSAPQAPVAPTK
ncbi:hypothetical protein OAS07_00600 [Candidatus Thioglobus sp.]|nr:hypothetical protein [Candidatus Thioglobus sp.]MDC0888878.1 hypothetical protein [Candidatus Thioglobus sp.]MDC0904438.1 hypothetical protein [Candidatus Thioglobus sp.]MDC0919728.1 hypothetical protein [Candidatus Thioglobus sp.]MDC0964871.1 hypothetical protein [Candidatus Thioglobus sp.]